MRTVIPAQRTLELLDTSQMGDPQPDPLNLFFLERDYVKEGMNIYVLGFPAEHLRDGKRCTRCLEAPKKLYTCAKCKNPVLLYCVCTCFLLLVCSPILDAHDLFRVRTARNWTGGVTRTPVGSNHLH
jgi:hypothetical protein